MNEKLSSNQSHLWCGSSKDFLQNFISEYKNGNSSRVFQERMDSELTQCFSCVTKYNQSILKIRSSIEPSRFIEAMKAETRRIFHVLDQQSTPPEEVLYALVINIYVFNNIQLEPFKMLPVLERLLLAWKPLDRFLQETENTVVSSSNQLNPDLLVTGLLNLTQSRSAKISQWASTFNFEFQGGISTANSFSNMLIYFFPDPHEALNIKPNELVKLESKEEIELLSHQSVLNAFSQFYHPSEAKFFICLKNTLLQLPPLSVMLSIKKLNLIEKICNSINSSNRLAIAVSLREIFDCGKQVWNYPLVLDSKRHGGPKSEYEILVESLFEKLFFPIFSSTPKGQPWSSEAVKCLESLFFNFPPHGAFMSDVLNKFVTHIEKNTSSPSSSNIDSVKLLCCAIFESNLPVNAPSTWRSLWIVNLDPGKSVLDSKLIAASIRAEATCNYNFYLHRIIFSGVEPENFAQATIEVRMCLQGGISVLNSLFTNATPLILFNPQEILRRIHDTFKGVFSNLDPQVANTPALKPLLLRTVAYFLICPGIREVATSFYTKLFQVPPLSEAWIQKFGKNSLIFSLKSLLWDMIMIRFYQTSRLWKPLAVLLTQLIPQIYDVLLSDPQEDLIVCIWIFIRHVLISYNAYIRNSTASTSVISTLNVSIRNGIDTNSMQEGDNIKKENPQSSTNDPQNPLVVELQSSILQCFNILLRYCAKSNTVKKSVQALQGWILYLNTPANSSIQPIWRITVKTVDKLLKHHGFEVPEVFEKKVKQWISMGYFQPEDFTSFSATSAPSSSLATNRSIPSSSSSDVQMISSQKKEIQYHQVLPKPNFNSQGGDQKNTIDYYFGGNSKPNPQHTSENAPRLLPASMKTQQHQQPQKKSPHGSPVPPPPRSHALDISTSSAARPVIQSMPHQPPRVINMQDKKARDAELMRQALLKDNRGITSSDSMFATNSSSRSMNAYSDMLEPPTIMMEIVDPTQLSKETLKLQQRQVQKAAQHRRGKSIDDLLLHLLAMTFPTFNYVDHSDTTFSSRFQSAAKQIPNSFPDATSYIECFEPLLLLEIQAQLQSEVLESNSNSFNSNNNQAWTGPVYHLSETGPFRDLTFELSSFTNTSINYSNNRNSNNNVNALPNFSNHDLVVLWPSDLGPQDQIYEDSNSYRHTSYNNNSYNSQSHSNNNNDNNNSDNNIGFKIPHFLGFVTKPKSLGQNSKTSMGPDVYINGKKQKSNEIIIRILPNHSHPHSKVLTSFLKVKVNWRVAFLSKLSTACREWQILQTCDTLSPNLFQQLLNPVEVGRNMQKLSHSNCVPPLTPFHHLQITQYVNNLTNERGFNDSQRLAISKSVNQNGFSFIQGPPGTGKTKTVHGILSLLVALRATPILVCTPSNSAVDEVALRVLSTGLYNLSKSTGFITDFNCVRVGRYEDMPSKIKTICIDANMNSSSTAMAKADTQQNSALSKAQIIFTTLSSSASSRLLKANLRIKTVIIDEAAQAVELSTLIPLQYECQRCIMIGDPQQLPATVISRVAMQFAYSRSFFARTIQCIEDEIGSSSIRQHHNTNNNINGSSDLYDSTIHMLKLQYRMNEVIMAYPSLRFYNGQLLLGKPVQCAPWHHLDKDLVSDNVITRRSFAVSGVPLSSVVSNYFGPLRFFDLSQFTSNTSHQHKYYSMDEISFTLELIESLFSSNVGQGVQLSHQSTPTTSNNSSSNNTSYPNNNNNYNNKDVTTSLSSSTKMSSEYSFLNKITILTPYQAQKSMFNDALLKKANLQSDSRRGNWWKSISAHTIDSFQGKENHIIIFSTVRSKLNNSKSIGFLDDIRRMNVALTRAKDSLWIVGQIEALYFNSEWRELIDYMKQNDQITYVKKI